MTAKAALPLDVRLMNGAAVLLLLVFCGLCAAAAMRWASRLSVFDIAGITVTGDTRHNNALTLRANVASRIRGNFFSVDLGQVRTAFESVPWVRHAVVRRDFPNRLRVELQEHRAVALWGSETNLRLLNHYGAVFEANVDEADQDNLPTLNGPEEQSPEVLRMYQALAPLFAAHQLPVKHMELTGRGSWRLQVAPDATVELGRGSVQEVLARTNRLLKTLTQVVSRYGRQVDALEFADLRHENGYAIRLRGVSTTDLGAVKQ